MAINDNDLQIKINTLVSSIAGKQESVRMMLHTLESLRSIQLDGTANPNDDRTGQTMSDATRQAIYDACMAKADELLGTSSDDA